MESIEGEISCPVCKMGVLSDADALKHCKTCGMNIKYDSILVKRYNKKFYFCSEYCKGIFLRFGFKSFRLHSICRLI